LGLRRGDSCWLSASWYKHLCAVSEQYDLQYCSLSDLQNKA
jgi:hypothetical protein